MGFQIAFAKFGPEAAIGGLSALFHYNLAEPVPGHVWVLVRPKKRTGERGYKLLRTKVNLDYGIVSEKGYRIASVDRAVLEGLKFIPRIGEKTAIKAAREALANGQTSELKLEKSRKRPRARIGTDQISGGHHPMTTKANGIFVRQKLSDLSRKLGVAYIRILKWHLCSSESPQDWSRMRSFNGILQRRSRGKLLLQFDVLESLKAVRIRLWTMSLQVADTSGSVVGFHPA